MPYRVEEPVFKELVKLLHARRHPFEDHWLARCPYCEAYLMIFPDKDRFGCSFCGEKPLEGPLVLSIRDGNLAELLGKARQAGRLKPISNAFWREYTARKEPRTVDDLQEVQ